MRRRIDPGQGMELVRSFADGSDLSDAEHRLAVRFVLEEFGSRYPGRSVEIRVPWIGAVQAIAGPVHTRGTPANVVELGGESLLRLAVGKGVDSSSISYSGTRADLSQYFPLFDTGQLTGGKPGQAHDKSR